MESALTPTLTDEDIADLEKLAALAGEGYVNCRLCDVDEPCELHADEYAIMRAGEAAIEKCHAVVGGGSGSGMGTPLGYSAQHATMTHDAYRDASGRIILLLHKEPGVIGPNSVTIQIHAGGSDE